MTNLPDAPDSPQGPELGAFRADNDELRNLRSSLTPGLRLARAVWGLVERPQPRLTPIRATIIVDAIREAATHRDEDPEAVVAESRLVLGVALVALLWGLEGFVASTDAQIWAAVASVLLAAEHAATQPQEDVLHAWADGVRCDVEELKLGPGWRRRAKGVDVELSDSVEGAPANPDLPVLLEKLARDASPRERQLLAILIADPGATGQDLACALGCSPSTARVLLARLRRRAEL